VKLTSATVVPVSYRLMLEMERAAHRFPRSHKYACGAEMRTLAYTGHRLAENAWRARKSNPAAAADFVAQLIIANDELKSRLKVAYDLQMFKSTGQFEELAELANNIGRQVGAWFKALQKHPTGQIPNA
jgi:hypothetical protein